MIKIISTEQMNDKMERSFIFKIIIPEGDLLSANLSFDLIEKMEKSKQAMLSVSQNLDLIVSLAIAVAEKGTKDA